MSNPLIQGSNYQNNNTVIALTNLQIINNKIYINNNIINSFRRMTHNNYILNKNQNSLQNNNIISNRVQNINNSLSIFNNGPRSTIGITSNGLINENSNIPHIISIANISNFECHPINNFTAIYINNGIYNNNKIYPNACIYHLIFIFI